MARRRPNIEQVLLTSLPRESSYLVAVSGGVDSMVLLNALLAVRAALKSNVSVVHIDHRIREDSSVDAEFVATECEKTSTTCFIRTLNPEECDENFEKWARDNRYKIFSEIRTQNNLDWILTAHHASDVAETLLMRLLANKEPNSIMSVDEERRCRRPFLPISRSQIEEYARQCTIPFREDSTNFDTRFTRNKVRHVIMPLLKREFSDEVEWSLAERASILADDEHFISSVVSKLSKSVTAEWGSHDWVIQLLKVCNGKTSSLEWRVVEELFRSRLGYPMGYRRACAVLSFIRKEQGAGSIDLPGGSKIYWNKNGQERQLSCKFPDRM